MKKEKIEEFKKRFELSDEDWNCFLVEYQEGISIKQLCESYKVDYNSFRYLSYELLFESTTKVTRKESVLRLQKDLARENGEEYDLIHELEKELDSVVKKNRQLTRSITHARDENNNLRKMMRDFDRALEFEQKMFESFDSYICTLELTELPKPNNIDKTIPKEGLCAIFSDEHVGAIVNKEVVPHNEFNYDIAFRRINKVVDELINVPWKTRELNMFQLLDILNGALMHDSYFTTEIGVTESILRSVDIYTAVYEKLYVHFEKINVYVSNSNHDRVPEKVPTYRKYDNYGIMIFKMVEKMLKAKGIKNIEFNYTKHDYLFTEINGEGVFALHGDSVRRYTPHSEIEVAKMQDICLHIFKKPFKHILSGHKHYSCVNDNQYGGKNVQNATLLGNNDYGMTNGFRPITPSQTIFKVNEEGNIEDLKIVNLSKII